MPRKKIEKDYVQPDVSGVYLETLSVTAQRIRLRLNALGLNAYTLAEKTGLSTGLLKRYMDAPKEKPIDIGGGNLCRLADALETTTDYLLGRTAVATVEQPEIRAMCDYLGLSETSVAVLHGWAAQGTEKLELSSYENYETDPVARQKLLNCGLYSGKKNLKAVNYALESDIENHLLSSGAYWLYRVSPKKVQWEESRFKEIGEILWKEFSITHDVVHIKETVPIKAFREAAEELCPILGIENVEQFDQLSEAAAWDAFKKKLDAARQQVLKDMGAAPADTTGAD